MCCCLRQLFNSLCTKATQVGDQPTFDGGLLKGKKGVGFTLNKTGEQGSWVENLPKVVKLRVSWNYSWGSSILQDLQPIHIDFQPMIWGYVEETNLREKLCDIKKTQTPAFLMAFNEPDKEDQSNISVDEALNAWKIMESANIPLVSPSCANPLGDWMDKFMDEAIKREYRVDIIGVHNYGGIDPNAFQARLSTIHERYEKPVLVTEFAPADWDARTPEENRISPQQVLDFMKAILPWMESQSWIVGYAWFPFSIDSPVGTSSALFDNDGNLTACGKYYSDWRGNTKNAAEK